jgi:hypothetical protein
MTKKAKQYSATEKTKIVIEAIKSEMTIAQISVSVNFPALYDAAKSLASMLYGRIARNSSLFFAL